MSHCEETEGTIYPAAACVFKKQPEVAHIILRIKCMKMSHTHHRHMSQSPACQPSTVGTSLHLLRFHTAQISVTLKFTADTEALVHQLVPGRHQSLQRCLWVQPINTEQIWTITFGLAPPTELAALRSALRGKGRCLCTVAAVRRGGNTTTQKSAKTSSCDFWPPLQQSLKEILH